MIFQLIFFVLLQIKNLTIEYQYIFTGCYSLRFTIDGKNYITSSNEFFNSNYTMTNIKEPQIRCFFDNRDNLKDMYEFFSINYESIFQINLSYYLLLYCFIFFFFSVIT